MLKYHESLPKELEYYEVIEKYEELLSSTQQGYGIQMWSQITEVWTKLYKSYDHGWKPGRQDLHGMV